MISEGHGNDFNMQRFTSSNYQMTGNEVSQVKFVDSNEPPFVWETFQNLTASDFRLRRTKSNGKPVRFPRIYEGRNDIYRSKPTV